VAWSGDGEQTAAVKAQILTIDAIVARQRCRPPDQYLQLSAPRTHGVGEMACSKRNPWPLPSHSEAPSPGEWKRLNAYHKLALMHENVRGIELATKRHVGCKTLVVVSDQI
jgi:hypothetical protein